MKINIQSKKTLFYLFLTFLSCLLGTWFAFLLADLVDLVLKKDLHHLTLQTLFILGFLLISISLAFIKGCVHNALLKEKSCGLRSFLFRKIFSFSVEDFQKHNSGEYLNLFLSDCELIEENYFKAVLTLFEHICQLVIVCVAVIFTDPIMFFVMLIMSIITVVVMNAGNGKIQTGMQKFAESKECFSVFLKEKLSCFPLFSLYQVTTFVAGDFDLRNTELGNAKYVQQKELLKKSCLAEFVGLSCTVIIMAAAVGLTIYGRLTAGFVIASGQLVGKMISPLMVIPGTYAQLKSSQPVRERLLPYLEPLPSVTGNKKGKISSFKIEDLSFQYTDGCQPVFHPFSLTFEEGKHYLIRGKSGCGKTTLLRLLCKQLSLHSGQILVNGKTPLQDWDSADFFEQIGVLTQQNYIFTGTLRDNLCLYQTFSDEEIFHALRLASLPMSPTAFPEGLCTILTESGNNFSGGELQRIALARIFLHDFPWIFADEFTTGLDRQTAQKIESTLLSSREKTVIAISHQDSPEFLALFDEIIEL